MTGVHLDLSRIAQTNVALYRQMHDLGHDEKALRLARDAYDLVSVTFAGHKRACGKPFVCHLTGTASIAASLGVDADLIAAAILHAAYEQFFVGGNNQGAARLPPQRIRAEVGEAVERHVADYHRTAWCLATIPALAGEARTAQGDRAAILLLRLANELDDHLDLSMLYCAEQRRAIDAAFDLWIEMAEALGHPMLAAAFAQVRREHSDGAWTRPLATGRATSYPVLRADVGPFGGLRGRMRKLFAD